MWLWLVIAVIFLILAVFISGYPRVKVPRKASAESLEDPSVVQAYDRISQWPQFKFLRRMIAGELKKHHPGGKLVDVGCGPGYLIAVIAKSLPHLDIIGVDIAEEMLQAATDNLSSSGLRERVKFQRGDVRELPFEDNAVDFVVSSLSLHHWSEPEPALQEIRRVLKPGGQFLIFDLRRDSRRFFYWLIRVVTRFVVPAPIRHIKEPFGSILSSYTMAESAAFLSGAGFQQWQVKPGIGWMFLWGSKG